MTRLDRDRRSGGEARRETGQLDPDRPFEAVHPLRLDAELRAASGRDRRLSTMDDDLEVGPPRPDREGVLVLLALEPADVTDPDQVVAVVRRGEGQPRIGPQLPPAVVVVLEVEIEDRQAIRNQVGSRRIRLDDVARLAEGVDDRRRIEVTVPVAGPRIDLEPGVRTAGASHSFVTSPPA